MLTKSQMHNYQKRGVQLIIDKPKCALFLGMGLGKTITALTSIVELLSTLEVRRVLLIAPKRVVESVWAQEAVKWEHTKDLTIVKVTGTPSQRVSALKKEADIYLIGRDSIAWLCAVYGGGALPFDMCVIDESSSFKNHASKRFKALKGVHGAFSRVVLLTGTPSPKSLSDLWAQIYLLDGGERLGRTITAFRNAYLKQSYECAYKYDLQDGAEQKISNSIADICTSMSAKDYLDLPECVSVYKDVFLPDEVFKAYKKFEKEKVLEFLEFKNDEEIVALNAAVLYSKLLQCAGGAVYDEDRNVVDIHKCKLDALEDVVESCNGEPLLISWTYQHERDRIMKLLHKLNPQTLDSHNAVERWNKGEIQILLMHPASGGHGLNLQYGGRYLCFYSVPDSLELYQQIIARLARQGQTKAVTVMHLISKGTFDERVISALAKKERVQDNLLQSVKEIIHDYA